MDEKIKQQIIFVLKDDNEVMTAALSPDSELDKENKQMNRALIKEHNDILAKVENNEHLTPHELWLISDANEIDANDVDNIRGHYKQALKLNEWLDKMMELAKKPEFDDKGRCLRCGSKVSFTDVTDRVVYAGDKIVGRHNCDTTGRNCLKCNYPHQYKEYEDYDSR